MNSRWTTLISIVLVVFAYLVAAVRFFDINRDQQFESLTLPEFCIYQNQVSQLTNIWERERHPALLSGYSRTLDLSFPQNTRVFIPEMTGKTNAAKAGYYYYLTYYLFPRDVAVSVDQPAHLTKDGFTGRPPLSRADLLTNGFDFVVSFTTNGFEVRSLRDYPSPNPSNPPWFFNRSDTVIAILLPLLTALGGMWLLRLLLPSLYERIPVLEKLAYGFGLGMMAVAALTLGIKLCGFHGRGLVLMVTGVSAVACLWHNRKAIMVGMAGGFREIFPNPFVMAGVFVFFLIFRVAALQSIVEFDALAGWALKAKIFHLYTGSEIVRWFSNPRLAHAHLDYPTLVPSLHAATYDSIGHVNEFTTKFWPAWMLLLLVGALASLTRNRGTSWIHGPSFLLLALILLPAIWKYVLMEGGTMPMVFFTVLGFLQCAIWQVEKGRDRLALGLILLFGAAMTKFEGSIILAMTAGWMLLLPSVRPSLKPSPRLWRILVFCFLSALPFVCLRAQKPVPYYESGWAGYALYHPGFTLSNFPGIFVILLFRWFMNPSFASWSEADGRLHWNGEWEGLSSLYNHPTVGLAWVCLLMTIALWFAVPARRWTIIWMLAAIIGTMAAFSIVFASIGSITSLNEVINYTSERTSGRYLLPLLMAWATTTMTLFYADLSSSASIPGSYATALSRPGSVIPVNTKRRAKASKD